MASPRKKTNKNKALVMGIDVGTSSLKAVAMDKAGHLIATARAEYPLLIPEDGWAEQKPDDWWDALCRAVRELLKHDGVGAGQIQGMSIVAQMGGVIPVDNKAKALSNALIWLDTRSADQARRLMKGLFRINGYGLGRLLSWLRLTGGAPNLAGKDPVSKILWLKEERPEIYKATHRFLDVKDYLVSRLTGTFMTSQDCAHLSWLMDTRKGKKRWSEALLRRSGIDGRKLPPIGTATESAGGLSASAAKGLGLREGLAVMAGGGDLAGFAIGAGTPEPYQLHVHIGTSAWIGVHVPRRKVDVLASIGALCAADGKNYLLIAAQETAGGCLDWAARRLGYTSKGAADLEALDEAVSTVAPSASSPYFFPWFFGERVPVDDADVRGGFANVTLSHREADLAHAVMEGVAFNLRWAMGRVERLLPGRKSREVPVRFVGGGANSITWAQILADVLERDVAAVTDPAYAGAKGAAMMAAVGAGWQKDLSAAASLATVSTTVQPRADRQAIYRERFSNFRSYYAVTRAWYRRLRQKNQPREH